ISALVSNVYVDDWTSGVGTESNGFAWTSPAWTQSVDVTSRRFSRVVIVVAESLPVLARTPARRLRGRSLSMSALHPSGGRTSANGGRYARGRSQPGRPPM